MEQEASCGMPVMCDETDVLPECIPVLEAAVSPPPSHPFQPGVAATILSDPHYMENP